MSKSIIFGTAGHIDHGKSSLVTALTGNDPDRLKEEKEKGITIELGYAGLDAGDLTISFVDVPGHEKFVKTMIAGSVGFDAVLFCVDGREGIMPQTQEHFRIIKTIGVKHAVAAITKADKYSDEELTKTSEDVRNLFDGSGVTLDALLSVSIHDKNSIDKLKQAVIDCAFATQPKNLSRCYVMRADRVFTMKGHGTVVTGTSLFGKVTGDAILFNVVNGKTARVKSIQVHGKTARESEAGQRTALNLPDFSVHDIKRGDLLTENSKMISTRGVYAEIESFDNIPENSLIKTNKTYPVIIGSETYEGKIILYNKKKIPAGENAIALIRLDRPAVVFFNEPFIIQTSGPQKSAAGGRVLGLEETYYNRKTAIPILDALRKNDYRQALEEMTEIYHCGLQIPEPIQFSGLLRADQYRLLEDMGITFFDGYIIKKSRMDNYIVKTMTKLKEKGSLAMNKLGEECNQLPEKFRFFLLNTIVEEARKLDYIFDGHMLKLKQRDPFDEEAMNVLAAMKQDPQLSNAQLLSQKLGIPEDKVAKCLIYLCNRTLVRKVEGSTHITMELINSFVEKAYSEAKLNGSIDLNHMKQFFPLPRKLIVPLMEQLDKSGAFINRDNKRFIK